MPQPSFSSLHPVGAVVLRLDGDCTQDVPATQTPALAQVIAHCRAVELYSLRVAQQRGLYIRVPGCIACATVGGPVQPCFPGCRAALVAQRLAPHVLPGGRATRVAALAPRPIGALLLAWPTRAAQPYPADALAYGGSGARLMLRWQATRVVSLLNLEDAADAPEVGAVLADSGWRTRRSTIPHLLAQRDGWWRGWVMTTATTLPPTLVIPPITHPTTATPPRTRRAPTKTASMLGLAPDATVESCDPPPLDEAITGLAARLIAAIDAVAHPDTGDDATGTGATIGGDPAPPPPVPDTPSWPSAGTLLDGAILREVVRQLVTNAQFAGGVTKNGLVKLLHGHPSGAEYLGRLIYLWLDTAEVLAAPKNEAQPYRQIRKLCVTEEEAIRTRLLACDPPTDADLAAAAPKGLWTPLHADTHGPTHGDSQP